MPDEDAVDPDWFWGTEILERYPSGVDPTQLVERLKLTPTERLEGMLRALASLEEAKRSRAHRPPEDR